MEKKNNSLLIVIIVLLTIISVGLGGFTLYDKVIKKDNVTKEDSDSGNSDNKKKKLELSDSLVKNYYSYVKAPDGDGYYEQGFLFDAKSAKKEIILKDVSDKAKLAWAYNYVYNSEIVTTNCNEHKDVFNKYADKGFICGIKIDFFEDDISNQTIKTYYIKESVFKDKVNLIFGPNSYQKVDEFNLFGYSGGPQGFIYDANNKAYLYYEEQAGGVDTSFERTLKEAYIENNNLILKESVSWNDEKSTMIYTFKENSDGTYYWYSIKNEK